MALYAAARPGLRRERRLFDRIATLDLDGELVLLMDPRQLLDRAERDIVDAWRVVRMPEPA